MRNPSIFYHDILETILIFSCSIRIELKEISFYKVEVKIRALFKHPSTNVVAAPKIHLKIHL